jgi:hypothetical protein
MTCPRVCAALAAAVVVAYPAIALAQFPPPPGAPAPTVQDRWPQSAPPVQNRWPEPSPPRANSGRAAASPQAAPKRSPVQTATPQAEPLQHAPPAAHKPAPKPPSHVLACSGVFAKDSTHLKLALKYDARNIVFGQVDGQGGSKLNASILFPSDPRRRLEVLWNDNATHANPSVIAINGKSQWVAPKGLKLGLPIATLEKMNKRPFKIGGFGADGSASVIGWEGGALSVLPGGCKVGMRLFEDAKAPQQARNAVAGDKELLSNDANVRAVKPAVGEILIGY